MAAQIDSLHLGDGARHVPFAELERRFADFGGSPREAGSVRLLVRRGLGGGVREEPDSALLSVEGGMEGDNWATSIDRKPEAQLTAMETGVADIIANGQSWSLFGDQMILDLDLSSANLPVGSQVRVGTAVVEVSPKHHKGCAKYRARFGEDALRFISMPNRRPLNLRGLYFRVVTDGLVRVGDTARVLHRGPRAVS